jgi:hypothetical protein
MATNRIKTNISAAPIPIATTVFTEINLFSIFSS